MSARGFTLIELMTIMAIMALMLLAAVPSISGWLVNLKIRNAAMALQSGVQAARTEALRRNESVGFWLVTSASATTLDNSCTLSATSGSWVISLDSPVGACATAASTTTAPRLVTSHAVGDGGSTNNALAFSALSSDGASSATSITFNGFGRISTGTTPIARIDITSASSASSYRSLRLLVSGNGATRLCDPAITDSADPRYC
jgi:type IV fimbrial biogenesis protein FimT